MALSKVQSNCSEDGISPRPDTIEPLSLDFCDGKNTKTHYVSSHANWVVDHKRWATQVHQCQLEMAAQHQAAVALMPALLDSQSQSLEQQIQPLKKQRLAQKATSFQVEAKTTPPITTAPLKSRMRPWSVWRAALSVESAMAAMNR